MSKNENKTSYLMHNPTEQALVDHTIQITIEANQKLLKELEE